MKNLYESIFGGKEEITNISQEAIEAMVTKYLNHIFYFRNLRFEGYVVNADFVGVTKSGKAAFKDFTLPYGYRWGNVGLFELKYAHLTSMKGFPENCDTLYINECPFIKSLEGLKSCRVVDLRKIQELKSLAGLSHNLEKLNMYKINIYDLKEVPDTLKELTIDENYYNGFPKNIPSGLKILNANKCGVQSLNGIPEGVEKIICRNNELTDLSGCPKSVKYLDITNNKVTSLKGLPNGIKILICSENQLTNLEGCPDSVEELICNDNNLINLVGCPKSAKHIAIIENPITSLEGIQSKVRAIYTYNNNLAEDSTELPKLCRLKIGWRDWDKYKKKMDI